MRASVCGLLCVSVVAACGGAGIDALGTLQTGQLHYRASNALGVPLVAGTLRLVVHGDSSVTGSWSIDWVAGADTTAPVGPQVGSGTFSGRLLSDGSVQIDLNPTYVDNNVFLAGDVTTGGVSGAWTWTGFPGVISMGRFTAIYATPP